MKALRATSASLTSPSSQTNVLATWVIPVLHLLAVTGGCFSSTPVIAAENLAQPVEIKIEYIYKNNCSVCHGDRGDGRSRASTSLIPPPRNFTTASNLTREIMIATVTNGKPGTAMTSWKTQLSEQQIAAVVDYVRDNFMQEVIDQHLSYGRLVYGHNCSSCHGDKGQGVKPAWYAAAPRSFTSPQAAAELSRERMIAAVANGLPGSAMTGYADKLSMDHIEAVVDYTLDVLMAATAAPKPAPTAPIAAQPAPRTGSDSKSATINMRLPLPNGLVGDSHLGEQFFMGNCATCHGTLGNGQGPRAYFMTTKPRDFLSDAAHTTLNRPVIFSAITQGRPGTEMPAWGKVLNPQEIANVTEFVFQTFIQPGIK